MNILDLTSLKVALKGHRPAKDLIKAIQRYESAQSIISDLRASKAALDRIAEIDSDDHLRKAFGGALTTHAIVSYARATISQPDARFNIGVTKDYTRAQIAKHQEIADLRNKVYAHFGTPQGEFGKDWIDERAVIREDDVITFVWKRVHYLGNAISDLDELLSVAIPTVQALISARAEDLRPILRASFNDPVVLAAAREAAFVPERFFASAEGVAKFWASSIEPSETRTPSKPR